MFISLALFLNSRFLFKSSVYWQRYEVNFIIKLTSNLNNSTKQCGKFRILHVCRDCEQCCLRLSNAFECAIQYRRHTHPMFYCSTLIVLHSSVLKYVDQCRLNRISFGRWCNLFVRDISLSTFVGLILN